jgi:hypothetical protein
VQHSSFLFWLGIEGVVLVREGKRRGSNGASFPHRGRCPKASGRQLQLLGEEGEGVFCLFTFFRVGGVKPEDANVEVACWAQRPNGTTAMVEK